MALEAFHSKAKNNIAIVAKQSTIFRAEIFSTHVRQATNLGIRVFADIAALDATRQIRCSKGKHIPQPRHCQEFQQTNGTPLRRNWAYSA
jgi:hypothetical protein